MPVSVTRTLRLKVKTDGYGWLKAAAVEVNQVWNWCNATSLDAADRNRRADAKFLSGFDLCNLSAGSHKYFEHINANSIQKVCCEYAGAGSGSLTSVSGNESSPPTTRRAGQYLPREKVKSVKAVAA
jgi:hypothetical protein